MSPNRKALKAAFPHTLPILTGYLFLGASYGFLMGSKGFPLWYTPLMSLFIYAGSMQFVSVQLLLGAFQPVYAFVMALMINARHLFYGLSMLEKYRGKGIFKPSLVFALTDETFSVACSAACPEDVDEGRFLFFISLLNHMYWIVGSTAGALLQFGLAKLTVFNTNGIEFVMTALFFVIFLNLWEERINRIPALAGVGASVLSLVLFGADKFLPPAMGLILVFFLLQNRFSKGGAAE
jgi:4-azaleucine resistance transporter AzlC